MAGLEKQEYDANGDIVLPVWLQKKDEPEFDTTLPKFLVWDITDDMICMDIGSKTHYDLTDQKALYALRKLRWAYKARMDAIEKDIALFERRLEPTEHKADELRLALAKADRYMREEYPRLLEIALHEAGIKAK